MPELPEVETVAAALRQNLLGRRVTGLRVRFGGVFEPSAREVRTAILGKTLRSVNRHGKYLILNFADEADGDGEGWSTDRREAGKNRAQQAGTPGDRHRAGIVRESVAGWTHLMLHLRMTGQVFVLDDYRPDKHVHAVFDFDGVPVHYRDIRKFGRFTLVDDPERPRAIAHVGPDILRVRFPAWFERVCDRRAPIKAVLLDQGVAAGLGNIYVDEALFRAGLHPETPAAALTRAELHDLLRKAKAVLRLALRHGGTTLLNFTDFHGRPGNFRRKLRVYGRTGQSCTRCRTAVERRVVAGRSSHFCPHCQPSRRYRRD